MWGLWLVVGWTAWFSVGFSTWHVHQQRQWRDNHAVVISARLTVEPWRWALDCAATSMLRSRKTGDDGKDMSPLISMPRRWQRLKRVRTTAIMESVEVGSLRHRRWRWRALWVGSWHGCGVVGVFSSGKPCGARRRPRRKYGIFLVEMRRARIKEGEYIKSSALDTSSGFSAELSFQ